MAESEELMADEADQVLLLSLSSLWRYARARGYSKDSLLEMMEPSGTDIVNLPKGENRSVWLRERDPPINDASDTAKLGS